MKALPRRYEGPPFELAVQLGLVDGWQWVRVFGHNNDIDAGTEDLWLAGGVMTWPTTAAVVSLVSSSADDAAAGTGARVVMVTGLDAARQQISETVTLNGVGAVTTAQSFLRMSAIYVTEVGSGGANAGTITATIGGNTQGFIDAGQGNGAKSHFTVPAGYSFIPVYGTASVGRLSSSDLEINLQVRLPNVNSTNGLESWRTVVSYDFSEGAVVALQLPGLLLPAGTDIRTQGVSSGANLAASAEYAGYLIDNNYLYI